MTKLPIRYLSIPLGANNKETKTWEPVVNRFEQRLSGWKRGLLSKGGRLTLIKNTLRNLPINYVSLQATPVSVAKKLEPIQCRFLWDEVEDKRKYHLVAWKELKKLIPIGGLGIQSSVEMDVALQVKWLWRFMNEEGALWRRIIVAKFGVEGNGWFACTALQSHGKTLWKRTGVGKERFHKCIRWKVGRGDKINF